MAPGADNKLTALSFGCSDCYHKPESPAGGTGRIH